MPDARTGIARDPEVEEELADLQPRTAHDADVRVVEPDAQQVCGVAALGVGDAELHASEQPQNAELEADLEGNFEPLGAQPDVVPRGSLGAHGVIDESIVELRLQVQVFRQIQPQDEAHVIACADGTGREGHVADAGRREGVVGEVDAAADADLKTPGGGGAHRHQNGKQGENELFHGKKVNFPGITSGVTRGATHRLRYAAMPAAAIPRA